MTTINLPDDRGDLQINLNGLTAVLIDTARRRIAIDGISGGGPGSGDDLLREWVIVDLRHNLYGDFHSLRPATECNDAECAATQHGATPAAPMGSGHKCARCGERIDFASDPTAGVDHWVHDRTGKHHCAGTYDAAMPGGGPILVPDSSQF